MEEKGVKSEEDGGSGVMESEMLEEKSVRESDRVGRVLFMQLLHHI